jgi:integrase
MGRPKKAKPKDNKLFALAADDWKNEVLALQKRSSHKSIGYVVKGLVDEFGYKRVGDIEKSDIQKFIVKLSGRLEVGSLRHYLTTFKGIMEYADEDWDMPTRLKLPKSKRVKQEYYTFEECRKLLHHSSGAVKVLIMLLSETGCRIGEAVALQPADLDYDNKTISITKNVFEGVLQDTPKTDSSVRKICISERLAIELRGLCIPGPKSFIFRSPSGSRPMWPQQLTYMLKGVCKNAGVPYKACHAFRRGNITELLLTLGMPERIVGMRVGHNSQSITLGVYCFAEKGSDRKWVPSIEKLLYEGRNEQELS